MIGSEREGGACTGFCQRIERLAAAVGASGSPVRLGVVRVRRRGTVVTRWLARSVVAGVDARRWPRRERVRCAGRTPVALATADATRAGNVGVMLAVLHCGGPAVTT